MTSSQAEQDTQVDRSESQLRRRAQILAVTREALAKRGYDEVTMEHLASAAGVTRKTLYNQFGSKDELLLAAVSEIVDGYRGMQAEAEPGIPAILASRRAAVRQVVGTPAYADAMTKAVSQAPSEHILVDLLFRDGIAFVARQLTLAAERGELAPGVDIEEAAEQINAHGWGMSAHAVKGAISLDQLERKSLTGLLLILLGITTGARRRALTRLLDQTGVDERKADQTNVSKRRGADE